MGFLSPGMYPATGTTTGRPGRGFTENKGQFRDQSGKPNPSVLFTKDFGGMKVQVSQNGFSYEVYQVKPKWVDPATILYKVMTITSEGDTSISWPGKEEALKNLMYHYHRVNVRLEGSNQFTAISPLFKDSVRERWFNLRGSLAAEVNIYRQVRYTDVYPGIDMLFYTDSATGGFKYDFILQPGADPALIALSYTGAERIGLTPDGNLEITTRFGTMTESIPLCYSENDEEVRSRITGIKYQLTGNVIKFTGIPQQNQKMVIDPAVNLYWAAFFGGENADICKAGVTDSLGNNYICGSTSSYNNIATTGAYQDSLLFPDDGFIAQYSDTGQLKWATYLNGMIANDLDIGSSGELIITGDLGFMKFDSTGFMQSFVNYPYTQTAVTCDQAGNIITVGDSVRKFNSEGNLLWKIKFGSLGTTIKDVDCDSAGNIYFVGLTTDSTDISTANAHLPAYNGTFPSFTGWDYNYELIGGARSGDGFIGKLNSAGQLIFGTYYGGKYFDIIKKIAVDDNGGFVICGETNSRTGIATSGTFQESLNPQMAYGFSLILVGGQWHCDDPNAWALIDTCIVGPYYPKPYDTRCQSTDGFMAKFSSDGTRQWGTYYGDTGSEFSTCISSTSGGDSTYIAGIATANGCITYWSDCPQWRLASNYAYMKFTDNFYSGPHGYLAIFDSTGNRILGTYFLKETDVQPGSSCRFSIADIMQGNDDLVIAGTTHSVWSLSYPENAYIFTFNTLNIDTIYQPVHSNECSGDSTVLKAGVLTNPLTNLDFQWMKNGQTLTGETDSILIIAFTSAADTGIYYCRLMQGASSWKSDSINVMIRYNTSFQRITINNQELSLPDARLLADMDNLGDYDVIRQGGITHNDALSFTRNDSLPSLNSEVSVVDLLNDNQLFVFTNEPGCTDWPSCMSPSKLMRFQNGQLYSYENEMLNGVLTWADFDNDGKPEGIKIVQGQNCTGYCSLLYLVEFENDLFFARPAGTVSFSIVICNSPSIDIADYENDGDVDILFTGRWVEGSPFYSTSILVNSGGVFHELQMPELIQNRETDVRWLDEDADGKMDILFSHTVYTGGITSLSKVIEIYSNVSGSFILTHTLTVPLPFNEGSQLNPVITDFNNDGLHDIVFKTFLFQNTDTGFVLMPSSYGLSHSGLTESAIFSGDIDKDGDLDILGENRLFRNDVCNPPNNLPSSPSGLLTAIFNDTVTFSWQRSTDLETPLMGLTYNLRIGTTPGGNNIMSSMSDSTGWRKVVSMGNVYQNSGWWLHNLQPGTYYWSVQAIDNSFAGGPFAPEQSFTIYPQVPAIISVPDEYIGAGETNCYDASQTITIGGGTIGFKVQSGGYATMIAGQNIVFLPTSQVDSSGYLHGYITTTDEYCFTLMQYGPAVHAIVDEMKTEPDGKEGENNGWLLQVHPNPTNGILHLTLQSSDHLIPVQLKLYNLLGEVVYSKELSCINTCEISLEDKQPGLYLLQVVQGRRSEVVKVVKQQ